MNIINIEIDKLKEHPQNASIYGAELTSVEELARQIKTSGNIKPLVVTNNRLIISGHRRHRACKMLGMTQVPVEIRAFKNKDEELECLLLENSYRMKTMEQKIREAKIYEQIEAEKAKLRMAGGVENLPQGEQVITSGKTRDIVAQKLNIGSGKTYEKAKKVVAKIDELKAAGDNIKAVQLSSSLKESVERAYSQLRREEKLQEVELSVQEFKQRAAPSGFIDIYSTVNKYGIIYADPCWQYFGSGNKSADLHYKTMPINDICALPVKNIAADNCILFLWVTYPLLKDCFEVIEAWGFKYVTAGFCWVKLNPCGTPFFGLGSWTRANSELCLIATKGSVMRIDNTITQLLQSVREEHSKKPDAVRDLIVRLVGELPRIELFARQSAEGWDFFGNQLLDGNG